MIELNKVNCMDCLEGLKKIPDNSVDAVITDPPYGLGFMGKDWDTFNKNQFGKKGEEGEKVLKNQKNFKILPRYNKGVEASYNLQQFTHEWATECFRILKAGGYLLSFSGTRTYHRICAGIEDAGFEIRDMISWLYGSGFPKSHNIGKAVDKLQGNKREVIGISSKEKDFRDVGKKVKEIEGIDKLSFGLIENAERKDLELTKGKTEWEGWGTALKPSNEPIVMARKPLSEKSVALNVLKHGTGGINIDATRIEYASEYDKSQATPQGKCTSNVAKGGRPDVENEGRLDFERPKQQGRFPANTIFDEEAGKLLDEQSGISKSCNTKRNRNTIGSFGMPNDNTPEYSDKGGASRFFYCPKASKSERNIGCETLENQQGGHYAQDEWSRNNMGNTPDNKRQPTKNNHPTVKPIALMEYLIKMVTRENAIVVEPFAGSGTTCIACIKQNRNFIAFEREKEYMPIINARINHFSKDKPNPIVFENNIMDIAKKQEQINLNNYF